MSQSACLSIPSLGCLLLTLMSCLRVAGGEAFGPGRPRLDLPERRITVDGNPDDWQGIAAQRVAGKQHLWFGQGMTPDQWSGDGDLSYQWRAAWSGNTLCFLVEVNDDRVLEPEQPSSYLCDCVEIYLDCAGRGGRRVEVLDGRKDWFDRCDPKELRGYELHFLPSDPPRAYLDHRDKYAVAKPHTHEFREKWNGQVALRRLPGGYLMEIAMTVPQLPVLRAGQTIGIEVGICDDDGRGRESIMMWTGTTSNFWLTMDDYGRATLVGQNVEARKPEPSPPSNRLRGGAVVDAVRAPDGRWGIRVSGAGMASATQLAPVELEFSQDLRRHAAGYDTLKKDGNSLLGRACISASPVATLDVEDCWTIDGDVLSVSRKLTVHGSGTGGFLSAIRVGIDRPLAWPQVRWFAPGMIYGNFAHLTEAAIGGRAHYRRGAFDVRIREDRLPAPLLAAGFEDGSSLAVLNPKPSGATTSADAMDVTAEKMLIDERFTFGAIGAQERPDGLSVGYWYPGTEGEVTYRGDTYPGGQLHAWRRRYHPVRDGLTQACRVAFRFDRHSTPAEFYRSSWRWAWETLQPKVTPQDIGSVRKSLTDMLADRVVMQSGRSGLPNFINAMDTRQVDEKAILGFCGANLDAATAMLYEAARDPSDRGERLRQRASAVIDSFLRLKISPPEGEGFHLKTGQPALAIGNEQLFLRSFGDDVKRLLTAYRREKAAGRLHAESLAWCRDFAEWLLTQQQLDGSFPRSWEPRTGKVRSASPQSTYNAIPLLVLLHQITGESKSLQAAVRAGEFCWTHGHAEGVFVGGTIDNPDIIDKEAGTLSLEAYLSLFEATRERHWVDRARLAGDFAETWVYLWNVPMPPDADAAAIHWKPGVPTVGVQLIATGHSLVDCFMTYNPAHYFKLASYTNDPHYRQVAGILLHNTKNMLALPGRTFDLPGAGWQQEHWSFAPRRGFGLHRGWLPWVSTSHLNGLQAAEEVEPELSR